MSIKPVIQRARARQDVDAALEHYLTEAGERIALAFVATLEQAYGHLARHPASGSPRYSHELDLPGLRAWTLARFPYLVFYFERDDHIDVWRVLNMRCDVPAWMQDSDAR